MLGEPEYDMRFDQVQSLLLRALATPGDHRLGRGRHYLAEAVRSLAPQGDTPNQQQILAAYWSLVAQGLAYIDISQPAPENWDLNLTPAGQAALRDEEVNPDDPAGYLRTLYTNVPTLGVTVRMYVDEAVRTYYSRAYLACTVMIGVAAEAAFLDAAAAFIPWSTPPADKLKKLLTNPRANYVDRFGEFRKKLEEQKNRLPPDVRDALDIHMSAVLDLLRASRNDAGHPTGRPFHRDDCFTALRVFERLARRMYQLKAVFEAPSVLPNKPFERPAAGT